jgi:hypothetical protein
VTEPTTPAGRWLVDRSDWIDGLRAFRVRINNTAGPEDMRIHVEAIERESADAERDRIIKLIRDNAEEWDTTYSAKPGISLEYLLEALEEKP